MFRLFLSNMPSWLALAGEGGMPDIGDGGEGWDVTTLLENATKTIQNWGGMVIIMLGVVMILVSVWKAATGLISHGKTQTNWFVVAALLIFGGALAVGGWSWVFALSKGGQKTINDLGGGTSGTQGAGNSGLTPGGTVMFGLEYMKNAIVSHLA